MSYIIHAVRVGLMAGLLLGLFATSAWADSGWYAGIKGGISGGADADVNTSSGSLSLDTDAGPVVLGTLGYATGNGFRLETEVSWRSNDLDGLEKFTINGEDISEGSLTNLAVMLNGAYDFPLSPLGTPYVLGGIGYSRVEGELSLANGASGDEEEAAFAYQVGAGLAWSLTDALAFDVSYRFFGTSEVEFLNGAIEMNNTHHTGLAGLTYSF